MRTGIDNSFKLLKVGHCHCPQKIALKNGRWKKVAFPSLVAVIKHPHHGVILFDTGYHQNFHLATRSWPQKAYALATPFNLDENETLEVQLANLGISTSDVSHIFISHFHADHIAGLRAFNKAKIICSKAGYQSLRNKNKWPGVLKGLLPQLLPDDIEQRVIFIETLNKIQLSKDMQPFQTGINLFSDQSLIAIELPGHADGHFGLLYQTRQMNVFLIGDAA